MIVRKINYFRIFIALVILFSIIFGSIKLINYTKYKNSIDYSFITLGYNDEEIKIIKDNLNNNEINNLLKIKYNKNITKFITQKYFLMKNITKYLDYYDSNDSESIDKIIATINTESNIEWLDEEYETDTTKGELMLVNRLYGLSSDYEPDDIVNISSQYAYSGKKISESILDNIISLIEAGKEEGYTFVVSEGYRSYKEQEKLYNSYKDSYGLNETDKKVARPGHSEYQTGLSFDIAVYNKIINNHSESEEYKWIQNNAYKYGFIFRFTEDKKDLTGFDSSYWRLRYVGLSASELIYNEKICFEEYYAYFVNGK